MHLLDHSPRLSVTTASRLAETYYGVQASATPLPSERDQNFLLTTKTGEQLVLKIANSLEDSALLEAQNEMMKYLEPQVAICPRVVPALAGDDMIRIDLESQDETKHFVRLVSYIPGAPFGTINPQPSELLRDLGRKLGKVDKALLAFDHPAIHRDFHWDLAKGSRIVRQYASLIRDPHLRDIVSSCAADFENSLVLAQLRQSVIHGDANDYNVIVAGSKVVGLIDFGDVVHSYTVGDLAIALAYIVLEKADPLPVAAEVVAGYNEELPLTEVEIEVLFDLMLMRLCMSVCHAAHQQQAQPENEYLKISQTGIEQSLPQLVSFDRAVATEILRVR